MQTMLVETLTTYTDGTTSRTAYRVHAGGKVAAHKEADRTMARLLRQWSHPSCPG